MFSAIPGDPKDIFFMNFNSSSVLSVYLSQRTVLKSDLLNEFT